jgi:hypothetical protein
MNDNLHTNKRNELHEAVAGNGDTIYQVVTVNTETGQWIWIETFTTKAEAKAWMKCSAY